MKSYELTKKSFSKIKDASKIIAEDKASLKRMMEKHNPDENINRLNRAKRIEALYSDEHIDAMEYGYMLALETLVTAVCGVENKPTRDFTPEDNKAIKEFYTDLWSERVRFSL
jgi:hypothetical protein